MMKQALPDVIICDLNLPKMSGFELLAVIRRRFPHIPVIAMSGEYAGRNIPPGVIADVYLEKGGDHSPEDLVREIQELLQKSPLRANLVKPAVAPVWVPLNGKQYFVLTCTNCLRSFSLPKPEDLESNVERAAECEFCNNKIRYFLETRAVAGSRALRE
jgi:CheY-like chemotaxis protein